MAATAFLIRRAARIFLENRETICQSFAIGEPITARFSLAKAVAAPSKSRKGHIMGDKNPKNTKKTASQKKTKDDKNQGAKDAIQSAKQIDKTKK